MEILIQELSKVLNITIEKAIELYPILKQQFIIYNIINILLFFFISIAIAIGAILVAAAMGYDKLDKYINQFKIAIIVFGISVMMIIVLSILQYVLVPDLMIIKSLY